MNWINLTESKQIDEIIKESEDRAVVIFKNSPRCYISKFALRNFESSFENPTAINCYMVDVVQHKLISIEIADRFQINHESPQLLIISKGKAVYNASHENINAKETEKLLLRL
ncbi:bacillithiol system redox-active protein YtxJ [Myroides injenensis]|uniref:bacillithiol system redox-active protein YtxJ n=1 Tax=Myroides injenensis TaxID=1183151 RepID=UPI000288AD8D|nr:bacillithiol system redox-active protein YtxJ [Myroides injenensis]